MDSLDIDGELFTVRERDAEPGVYDVRWESGPREGYGFATAAYDGGNMSDGDLVEAVRDFLGRVDRTTGYLG